MPGSRPAPSSGGARRGTRELATIEDGGAPANPRSASLASPWIALRHGLGPSWTCWSGWTKHPPGQWQKAAWRLERQHGYLAKEQREVFVTHQLPDVEAAFGTSDPVEAAKRADSLVWGD